MADILDKRPVDAEMTIFKIEVEPNKLNACIDNILMRVNRLETKFAGVQPVKRGHWEEREGYGGWGDTYYHCSVCGSDWVFEDGTPEANEWDYCPKCGARMDGAETGKCYEREGNT